MVVWLGKIKNFRAFEYQIGRLNIKYFFGRLNIKNLWVFASKNLGV